MNLPGYIKEYLQINYYIPEDQLALPFDQMPADLQELISKKCFASEIDRGEDRNLQPVDPKDPDGPYFKNEESMLLRANLDVEEDLNSDVRSWDLAQALEFSKNHNKIMGLVDAYRATEKDPDDFDKTALLLAAKRMAAEDYADKPKDLDTFRQVKDEIKVELQVKYWMTQYFNAKQPTDDPDYQDKVTADIASIAQMIEERQAHKIAETFNLPQTTEAREEAKGATLTVAMMEVRSFAQQVESQVKNSKFYKEAEALNENFKSKYPKSYVAAKIVGGLGAAVTLGPVYSAARAAAGVNTLRKNFQKYKKEHPDEKGNMWKFIRTKENRQKLMGVGRDMLRIIPGVKAIGIALSAVKNSDMLKNSIQELNETKKTGGKKGRAWMKVGGAALGLLAVSATAAYLNDDVADTVNDFVTNMLHTQENVNDAVEQIAEQAQAMNLSGAGEQMRAALADSLEANPALAEMLQSNPALADSLAANPALVDSLLTKPGFAESFVASSGVKANLSTEDLEAAVPAEPSELLQKAGRFLDDKTVSGLSEQIDSGKIQLPEGMTRDEFIYKTSMLKAYAPYAEKDTLQALQAAAAGQALTPEQMEQVNGSIARVLPDGHYLGAYDKDFSSLSPEESQALFNKVAHSENPQEAYNQLKELHGKDPEAFTKLKEQYIGKPAAEETLQTSINEREDQADMSGVKYTATDDKTVETDGKTVGETGKTGTGDKAAETDGKTAGETGKTGAGDKAAETDGKTVEETGLENITLQTYKVGNIQVTEAPDGSIEASFGRENTSNLKFHFKHDGNRTTFVQEPGTRLSTGMLDKEDHAEYQEILKAEKARLEARGYPGTVVSIQANLNAGDIFKTKKIAEIIQAQYAENPTPELAAEYQVMAKMAQMHGVDLDKIDAVKEGLQKTDIQTVIVETDKADEFVPNSGTGKNWADATDENTAAADKADAFVPNSGTGKNWADATDENTAAANLKSETEIEKDVEVQTPSEIKMSNGATLTVSETGMRTVKTPNGSLFYKFQQNSNGEMMMAATSSSRLTAEEILLRNQLIQAAEKTGMSPGDASKAAGTAMLDMKVMEAAKAEYAANPTPELKANVDYIEHRVASNPILNDQQKAGWTRTNNLMGEKSLNPRLSENSNTLMGEKSLNPRLSENNNTLMGEKSLNPRLSENDGTLVSGQGAGGKSAPNNLMGEESLDPRLSENDGTLVPKGDQPKQVTVENIRFDTNGKNGGIVLSDGTDNGTRVMTNTTRSGSSIHTDTANSHSRVDITKKGGINVSTNTNNPLGSETIDNVKIDTENRSGRVVLTDGKNEGNKVILRSKPSSKTVEFETRGGRAEISIKNGKIDIGTKMNKQAINNIVGRLFGRGGKG